MIDWLSNLPSELGYGLATSLVLAIGGWCAARVRRRRGTPEPSAPARAIPRVLPRAPQVFVNRKRELGDLDRLIAQAQDSPGPRIGLLSGLHGVGKSAIGSLWVHRNYQRFSGGVLTADFSRRRNPQIDVSDVLGDFLSELGVSDVAMPSTLSGRQRLFERLTADRQLLVLLDDVDQSAQALEALPSGSGSVVLVTSAFRLEELVRKGAQPISLEPLDDHQARDLLIEMAGRGALEGDPSATSAVIGACGGLPIALCVCGARLAYPDHSATELAAQLQSWPQRLRTLSPAGEFDMGAVFSAAYEHLPKPAAMLYRRLGLHPGADFSAPAAAALAGMPVSSVRGLLEQLEDAYLLQGDGHARLRAHDLVRDHMRACVAADEDSDSREQALNRVIDWYTEAARAADHAVVEERLRLRDDEELDCGELPQLSSPREAFAWFALERRNVIAAQRVALEHERFERVWQIGEALWPLVASHKLFGEWIASQQAAIIAGERLHDDAVLARMHSQLARAYAERASAASGDDQRAAEEMQLALLAARRAGDPALLASVIEFGGVCQLRAGELVGALESFRAARTGFEHSAVARGVAIQDYHIGWCLSMLGDYELALDPLQRAQTAMEGFGDEINVGRSLVRRGEALWQLRRADEARRTLLNAIEVLQRAGVGFEQAEAHEALGEIAHDARDASAERAHRQSAYRLYRELGHPRAEELLGLLEGVRAG